MVKEAMAPLLKRLAKLEPEVHALREEVRLMRAEKVGLTNALIRRGVITKETAGSEIHRSIFDMRCKKAKDTAVDIFNLRLTSILEDAGLYHYVTSFVGTDAFDR